MADGRVIIDTELDSKGAINDSKTLGSKLKSSIGGAAKVATGALVAATGATAALATESVKTGATFDKSMAQVAATMGKTVDEIQVLRDFAQEMGRTTAFSATEAADALNYMALAGYDAETSMKMLPNVLNLAAAGGIDLAYASDMITDSQSALGLSLDETSQLVDKMAKASSKSNTSVAQLGEALLTVGGTAKDMVGGTTEMAQVLGVLADNGVKGAEGGTALRNILLSLTPKSEEAAAAMEKIGFNAFDAQGNLRPLQDTFEDMGKAMEGMSTEERQEIIKSIFNKADLKSVNALLGTSKERWDELAGAIDDSEGAAQQMADTQLDNLTGDITLLKSAFEGLQIAISDEVTPDLRTLAQTGQNYISQLTEAIGKDGIAGAFNILPDILEDVTKGMLSKIPSLIKLGASLLGAMGQALISSAPTLLQAGSELLLQFVTFLATELPTMINELAANIGEFEGLNAVGLTMINNIITGITSGLPNLLFSFTNLVLSMITSLSQVLPTIVQMGLNIIVGLAKGLLDGIPNLLTMLPDVISAIADGILDSIPLIAEAGVELLTSLVDDLPTIISTLVDTVPDIVSNLIDSILEHMPEMMQAGIDLFVALIKNIPKILSTLRTGVTKILSGILSTIVKKIPEVAKTGLEMFIALVKRLPEIISAISPKIGKILDAIIQGFKDGVTLMADVGKNLIEGVWEGIKNAGAWLKDKITGFADDVLGKFKDLFGIESPSKVMRDEVGKYIAQGIYVGFDKEDPLGQINRDIKYGIKGLDTSMTVNSGYYAGINYGEIGKATAQALIDADVRFDVDGRDFARLTGGYA